MGTDSERGERQREGQRDRDRDYKSITRMSENLMQTTEGWRQPRPAAAHEEMLRGTEAALQSGRSSLLKIEQQEGRNCRSSWLITH